VAWAPRAGGIPGSARSWTMLPVASENMPTCAAPMGTIRCSLPAHSARWGRARHVIIGYY
jgi:hypothetical protein